MVGVVGSSELSSSSDTKRSVSFPQQDRDLAIVALEIESIDDISEEDKKNLWYARSDYHFSRSSARVIAKESERYGHSKHLDRVYIPTFDQQVQDRLNLWALHGSSRRGLERWANSSHGDERKDDQHIYIKGVLRAQTDSSLRGEDRVTREEKIREASEKLSQKSRLFAKMIGDADARAAKWEFGITDVSLGPSSPREIIKQTKNLNLNLGFGGGQGLAGRRTSQRRSLRTPNLQGISSPLTSPIGSTRRSSTTTMRTTPRISIRKNPVRVSRMA